MANADQPQFVESKEVLGKATVAKLFYYPLKSAQQIEVQEADVDSRGISHDREYMLVAGNNFSATSNRKRNPGDFISRREVPLLGIVSPMMKAHSIQFSAPEMGMIELPFEQQGEEMVAAIRNDKVRTIDQGDKAARWFRDVLGVDVRLVRMHPEHVRLAGSHRLREDDQTSLSDGYPFLLTAEESLDRFNGNFRPNEKSMLRFRPNIVIRGLGFPYAEDLLQTIKIGDVVFDVVKPSPRCEIINQTPYGRIDQGEFTPLRELAKIRTAQIKPGEKGAIFGQNLVHRNTGRISVGDPVEVLEIKTGPQFVARS